jgi:hypothetical protein
MVKISVDFNNVINNDIVGVGWNFGPLWIPEKTDEKSYAGFFNAVKDSGQPWIRIMTQYYEWEGKTVDGKFVPGNDDDNPYSDTRTLFDGTNKGFVWNTEQGLHPNIIAILDYCEQNDIWVEFNNWETELKTWIDRPVYKKKRADSELPVTYAEYLRDAEEFGENVAAVVYYLKTKANNGKGYSCIKYYALWNEPNGGHKDYDFIHFDFPGCLNLIHKTVHEHLVKYDKDMGTNVMNEIQCIGLEGFPFSRHCPMAGHPTDTWPEMLGNGVLKYLEPPDGEEGEITEWPDGGPYMDIISIHDYWATFDYDIKNPLNKANNPLEKYLIKTQVMKSLDQIRKYDLKNVKPLFINELGSFNYSSENSTSPYTHSLYVVEAAVRMLNVDGVKAVSRWAWNMHLGYAAVSFPGCWWETEPKGVFHVIDNNFYPYTLLTKYAKRGSDVVKTTVTGSEDSSYATEKWAVKAARVWPAGFKTKDDKLSLVIVNDSYLEKDVEISMTGLTGESGLMKYYVTQDKCDKIYEGTKIDVSTKNNIVKDKVLPRSITVYTE